jgi:formylglycine-generating enzyme required for sulfatase activity
MVTIKGGTFILGNDKGFPDERPERKVTVSSFWMDDSEVTNAEFAEFVSATGYVTTAEKPLNPKDFPGVDPKDLQPGAAVFTEGKGWAYIPGAYWKHPEGPGSSIRGRENHPVVQVNWDDAVAYAKWAGKRLPTEAEWEYAAKGGKEQPKFVWGDQPSSDTKPLANIWQGEFPNVNKNLDGFAGTSPVRSFAPNGYGLYDMAGNVWEWCADFYRPYAYETIEAVNPKGPKNSLDPDEPGAVKRVTRGGSFLCAENYCRGYRPTARMKTTPDTGLCHTGFRCVKDLE